MQYKSLKKRKERHNMSESGEMIAGKNPVLEALRSGREMNKIWISEGVKKSGIKELISMRNSMIYLMWPKQEAKIHFSSF